LGGGGECKKSKDRTIPEGFGGKTYFWGKPSGILVREKVFVSSLKRGRLPFFRKWDRFRNDNGDIKFESPRSFCFLTRGQKTAGFEAKGWLVCETVLKPRGKQKVDNACTVRNTRMGAKKTGQTEGVKKKKKRSENN